MSFSNWHRASVKHYSCVIPDFIGTAPDVLKTGLYHYALILAG
ncbi:hypothetical protein [Alteromonas gilva]|uniref:Uncharacterized protein n=1 Tax=Alteromonas gilva TaxID=2987522 RepID=A0ABT5KZV4_9ALTE|nr:hypothetical protein [Alteromonas gilva]MDC8829731.1 hypothetical protein [Alteromonas gilva]